MIKRQLSRGETPAAVLAGMSVPEVEVYTGELGVSNPPITSLPQAYHGWSLEWVCRSLDGVVFVDFYDVDLLVEEERDSTLPSDDLERLVGRVEDECIPHFKRWARRPLAGLSSL